MKLKTFWCCQKNSSASQENRNERKILEKSSACNLTHQRTTQITFTSVAMTNVLPWNMRQPRSAKQRWRRWKIKSKMRVENQFSLAYREVPRAFSKNYGSRLFRLSGACTQHSGFATLRPFSRLELFMKILSSLCIMLILSHFIMRPGKNEHKQREGKSEQELESIKRCGWWDE